MKKLLYIGLILSFIACQPTKTIDYSTIAGKIENSDFKTFELTSLDYEFSQTITLNEDNSFNDTIKNLNKGYYRITLGKKNYKIYLEPSYSLNLNYDASNNENALKFDGKGAAENTFLNSQIAFIKSLKKYSNYKFVGKLDEADFLTKMDSVKKAKRDFLNASNNLGDHFKNLEEKNITYGWANQLTNYESMKRYVSKDESFKVSDDFHNYKKSLSQEDDNLISVSSYVSYFKNYILILTQEATAKDSLKDYSQVYLNFIADSISNQTLKNNLLYNDAKYSITYVDDFEGYYKIYNKSSTNKVNNSKIETIYNALKKVAKGNVSPLFVDYENYAGGTTSLIDLRGKFVYIDVWATWCGPCIAEIPSLKKIEKAYHKKNIAFVSLSVDTDKAHDAWRKMIKDEKLGGIQLFSDKNWNSKFVTDYMIKGIPRFILIDPKGNIVSANAPRPSSPKLIKLFEEYNL